MEGKQPQAEYMDVTNISGGLVAIFLEWTLWRRVLFKLFILWQHFGHICKRYVKKTGQAKLILSPGHTKLHAVIQVIC